MMSDYLYAESVIGGIEDESLDINDFVEKDNVADVPVDLVSGGADDNVYAAIVASDSFALNDFLVDSFTGGIEDAAPFTGGIEDAAPFTGGIEDDAPFTGGIEYDDSGPVTGGSHKSYHFDKTKPAEKDSSVSKLIPAEISECAIYLGNKKVCSSSKTVAAIGAAIGVTGAPEEVIDAAKKKTECDSERCVIGRLNYEIGDDVARRELAINFKVKGPQTSKLLSNVNIDKVMRQWGAKFPEFFPYNFNMRNYASYSYDSGYILEKPDTLATILFEDLYNGTHDGHKYKCCGCIVNTDTYQGDGKHWMALFADARGGEWSIEFFNSSGNSPSPEWVSWMEKTRVQMEKISEAANAPKRPIKMVKVTDIRHQNSKSECGVYSLFYVWARLNGVAYDYFKTTPIPDQLMFEFRQHLFADESYKSVKKFDWNEYRNTVHIEWE